MHFTATYGEYAGRLFESIGKLSHRAAKAFSINSDSTDKRGFKTGGGKKTDIVRDCVEVLLREGYDIDESLAQLAIEIYTR